SIYIYNCRVPTPSSAIFNLLCCRHQSTSDHWRWEASSYTFHHNSNHFLVLGTKRTTISKANKIVSPPKSNKKENWVDPPIGPNSTDSFTGSTFIK
ncbi:hypothetical protein A2U01_0037433, partial [Trifolium medium]|nr:hypothetical protein [Trifolium medium]